MKLLFDHNLSPRLVTRLADVFPNASHTAFRELGEAPDSVVWAFARSNDYTIVTKDSDFADLSILHGAPPKVIILRIGNCTTTQIEEALRRGANGITSFVADPQAAMLHLHGISSR
jgi:predicted nuclease of predicted toxin-antitoxin system